MKTERRRAFIAAGWGFVLGAVLIAPWAYSHAIRRARKPSFVLPLTALLMIAPGGSVGATVAILVSGRRSRRVENSPNQRDRPSE